MMRHLSKPRKLSSLRYISDSLYLHPVYPFKWNTLYGAHVAWRRFGSHLQLLQTSDAKDAVGQFLIVGAGIGDDYQSGAKLHALHRLPPFPAVDRIQT